jgi:cell division protein FtsB
VGIRILIRRPQRRPQGLRAGRFLWIAAGAAIWGLAYSVFGATGLVGVYRTEAEVELLEEQVNAARAVNDSLRLRVEALRSDPAEIEREARVRLGLVKEGDRVYLLPTSPSDDASSPVDPRSPADAADSGPVRRP